MAKTDLNTLRAGVRLLSSVVKEAHNLGTSKTDKVTAGQVQKFLDAYGSNNGAVDSLDTALSSVFAYAQKKTGTKSPTMSEINGALSDAMKAIAKNAGRDKKQSDVEEKALAKTWKAVSEFAKDFKGSSISDIMTTNGE